MNIQKESKIKSKIESKTKTKNKSKIESKTKTKIVSKRKSELNKNKKHFAYNKKDEEYNPKLINTFNAQTYFPQEDLNKLNQNNISKLQMTNIGTYSISKPKDADWITNSIIHHYTYIYPTYNNPNIQKNINKITIIDGTAGMGGNVISFAKKFHHVIGVEYNKVHYEVCKNNVELFKYKNVEMYNDSLLNYYKKYDIQKDGNQTIFFFDPPWGGSSYKKQKYVHLGIGGLHVTQFLNQLHEFGYKYIVLKAPRNFIISDILLKTKYQNVHICNYYNMILLFIF
jgi:hypothetical protein